MVFSWDETVDLFKNMPVSFLLPFVAIVAMSSAGGAGAAHEFDVFRMYQYELHGRSYGCQGSLVNMEARLPSAKQLHRRCVVVHMDELSAEGFSDLIQRGAGSVLVILPVKLSKPAAAKKWHILEEHLLAEDVSIPVYFAMETPQLMDLHSDIVKAASAEESATAVESLLGIFAGQGYQMVAHTPESKPIKDAAITTLVGKLSGRSNAHDLPTLAIVAHYDSHSVSPHLSFGGDSNGSGVIALLELARIFAQLYGDGKTKPNFNLLFVLSGGGKFDYQGTRQWIETSVDSDDNPLANAHYVLCLDSIGQGDGLNIHVSKPPKEGTPAHKVVASLKEAASALNVNFSMVHKKINLAEDRSAWEHEKFSLKRIPAATLSWYPTYKSAKDRHSVYDQRSNVDSTAVSRNIHVLAEGISHYVFNMSSEALGSAFNLFNSSTHLHHELISSWLEHFSSLPRSQQLIGRDHYVLTTLEQQLSRSCPVTRHVAKADKKDPDFIFYGASKAKMTAYSIKPGIFDLVLAVAVALYLVAIFGLVQVFPKLASGLSRVVQKSKVA